jgi:maltose O-acetyltransferase
MTENKLKKGTLFSENKHEMHKKWVRSAELLHEFNQCSPVDAEKQQKLISELFGEIGKGSFVTAPFTCNLGFNIKIGKHTFINANAVFLDPDSIEIGDVCLLGPGVQIFAADHPISTKKRVVPIDDSLDDGTYKYIDDNGNFDESIEYTFTNCSKPVKIGNRCWIGANAMILPGVTIGDNVIIGAGSLVNKDIPSNTIAVGSPAKIIRENIE